MTSVEKIAEAFQCKARQIIEESDVINIWKDAGAEIHLVGSLRMGLLINHRDIDFHIYSQELNIRSSFAAMSKLAQNPRIRQIQYVNLLDKDDKCLEWHAWYEDNDGELWQLDMIHIVKGSRYDGYFETVAERISAALTDETRQTILRLKYETPDTAKIMGMAYYMAVIRDGIRTYSQFEQWRKENDTSGIIEWMP